MQWFEWNYAVANTINTNKILKTLSHLFNAWFNLQKISTQNSQKQRQFTNTATFIHISSWQFEHHHHHHTDYNHGMLSADFEDHRSLPGVKPESVWAANRHRYHHHQCGEFKVLIIQSRIIIIYIWWQSPFTITSCLCLQGHHHIFVWMAYKCHIACAYNFIFTIIMVFSNLWNI